VGLKKYTIMLGIALLLAGAAVSNSPTRASFVDTSALRATANANSLLAPTLGVPTTSGLGPSTVVSLAWTKPAGDFATQWRVFFTAGACPQSFGAPATTVAVTSANVSPGVSSGPVCFGVRGKFQNWLSPLSNLRQVNIQAASSMLFLRNISSGIIAACTQLPALTLATGTAGSSVTVVGNSNCPMTAFFAANGQGLNTIDPGTYSVTLTRLDAGPASLNLRLGTVNSSGIFSELASTGSFTTFGPGTDTRTISLGGAPIALSASKVFAIWVENASGPDIIVATDGTSFVTGPVHP
jgi:hypothetical protein